MSLKKLDISLSKEIKEMQESGRAKEPERIINGYIPPQNGFGPRYRLQGEDRGFLRMNSNSYLSLSHHPSLINAADKAGKKCGVGPGAVRFIDGTFTYHVALERRIARFVGKPAAKIFTSAYMANNGLALTIGSHATYWIGDQLNHNSIIRSMRIAGVSHQNRGIFRHNDMDHLQHCLDQVGEGIERVVVIFDGVYSMRGDHAPIDKIKTICQKYNSRFKDGIITVVDDSHGIGAYGAKGRGTSEYCGASPDIIVGTFGKAFGVNGGFIAASSTVAEAVRQKADTYIYTNPLSVADCAAATEAIKICDSPEGIELLENLRKRTNQFREGLARLGKKTIPGPHPIVPLLVQDTATTHALVDRLYAGGVLAIGLTFPVVPLGDESIRFQINAAHTEKDIDYVLDLLS